ncbi:hypothetical protein LHFGNBLO_003786 [Mesorhizobium sp. AR10]|uniref:hypothetical protein n=1 Tax=Mesorhizobium sp. AR10 TaxID=2865839 RepID=UPI00215F1AA6|nr:hypothetical protein [Mesorhizobium sp. AR10]UVK36823.1 hypothetical protein LHFGNBLO_003786 [Mesorhizobium sp. AR10]
MNDFSRASGLVINSATVAPAPSGITVNGRDLASMSTTERHEELRRVDAAAEQAKAAQKEAALQAQIAAATERSLQFNEQLRAQRVGINTGQALSEGQKAQVAAAKPMNGSAPQALVDQLPVTVGGIQLGPKQAREMADRGEITRADYVAAVNAALAPYGHSFK